MSDAPVILQVVPELVSGGVERGTIEIARAIVEAGGKSIVVSHGGALEAQLAQTGTTHIKLPVHKKNPLTVWANIGRLENLIKKHQVSLVHARSRIPAWSAYYAAKRTKRPFITTFHGVYGLEGMGKKQYNSIMVRGEKVIAVSNYIREHILTHYPECPPENIEVIHRGADLVQFHPNALRPMILADLANKWMITDQHVPVIMLPGRLSRWKGHSVLIDALAEIKDCEFICIMVGNEMSHPALARELEQQIRERGLEEKVRFVGRTNYMAEAYALSDIVVVPSTEPEAFGRVPVEAQAMGKLVISTDHGGARETIIHGQTGFLVPPSDPAALAATLRELLSMPIEARNHIGSAAMAHIDENFSIAVMQQKTIAVYAKLLGYDA